MTFPTEDNDMIRFISELPKTEIHIHIEAAVTYETYKRLNAKYKINPDLRSLDDYKKLFNFNNLSDMIKSFLYLQTFFRDKDDFSYMASDLAEYADNNNIYYIEAFFSPSGIVREGKVKFEDAVRVLETEFDAIQEDSGIDIRLIIDVSRTFGKENAQTNLEYVKKYMAANKNTRILGIGLGGAEEGNSAKEYKEVFATAQKLGLYTVAHAGEEVDSSSIWDALKELKVSRIGHGTSAIYDNELMDYLKEHEIPLEICPTSNIVTKKYVSEIQDHPIRKFYDKGINVTVNTDDPILFNITLNKEYYKLYKFLNFTKAEIKAMVKNSLYATLKKDAEKDKLWKEIVQRINAIT